MKQNPEPDRRLHRPAERRARFSHAEMKRIIDLFREQTISRHGTMHVRRFERNDDVSEIEFFEDLNVAQRRLDHRFWSRSAILLQQILLERATVHTDPDRNLLRLRGTHDL